MVLKVDAVYMPSGTPASPAGRSAGCLKAIHEASHTDEPTPDTSFSEAEINPEEIPF